MQRSRDDLGQDFGGGLTTRELDYLVEVEWARTPDDVLWRRSRLGLHVPDAARERLADYMAERVGAGADDDREYG